MADTKNIADLIRDDNKILETERLSFSSPMRYSGGLSARFCKDLNASDDALVPQGKSANLRRSRGLHHPSFGVTTRH